MANICENRLVVVVNAESESFMKVGRTQLRAFRERAKSAGNAENEASDLSLEQFLPTPAELMAHQSPQRDTKLAAEFTKKYGADDWYNWRVKFWGIKWDLSDVSADTDEDSERAEYDFTTPWGPPTEAFTAISKLYPFLEFRLKYDESGMAFMGAAIIQNGIADDNSINY